MTHMLKPLAQDAAQTSPSFPSFPSVRSSLYSLLSLPPLKIRFGSGIRSGIVFTDCFRSSPAPVASRLKASSLSRPDALGIESPAGDRVPEGGRWRRGVGGTSHFAESRDKIGRARFGIERQQRAVSRCIFLLYDTIIALCAKWLRSFHNTNVMTKPS